MNLGTDMMVYPWTFDIPSLILEIKSAFVSEDLTESSSMFVASSVLEIGSNFSSNKAAYRLFFFHNEEGCLCVIQKIRSVSHKELQLCETYFCFVFCLGFLLYVKNYDNFTHLTISQSPKWRASFVQSTVQNPKTHFIHKWERSRSSKPHLTIKITIG